MKTMKKALALIMVAAMVMSLLCVSAFATGTESHKLTVNAAAGHQYKVYQMLVGDVTGLKNGSGTLSNITLGSNNNSATVDAFLAAIKDTENSTDTNVVYLSGEDLGDAVAALKKGDPIATLDTTTNNATVVDGYYLVIDEWAEGATAEQKDGNTLSKYMVDVTGDTTIEPKDETVTSDKTEYNDTVTDAIANDAGVGTVSSYTLTATIAADAGVYDYYNFILADTLSIGLTFNDDIKVTIDGTAATLGTDYAVYKGEDGYTFEVALLDAKAHPGKQVVVTYSATMNSDAVAMIPETNTYKVIYSNNPEHSYKGDQDSTKPGKPTSITSDVFGKTPEKQTKTYDTKLVLTKTDGTNKLAGATFKLTSTDANQTVINSNVYYTLDNENGTYYLLKDGTYTDKAPTDTSYVNIGTGDSNTTVGYLLKDDGTYYVPSDVKEYDGKDLYQLVLGTSSKYASTNKYSKATASSTASQNAPVEVVLTTGDDGVLNFTGLGTGSYTLTEVDAPDGFNYLASDITFTISFEETKDENDNVTGGTFTISNVNGATITTDNGTFATTVVDNKGSVLPSTGGVGTTLFYVFGAILVLAAGVLLITKKRMGAHE